MMEPYKTAASDFSQVEHEPRDDGLARDHHTVLVLDDDHSVLNDLRRLLTSHGYDVRVFAGTGDFFKAGPPPVPACLILDHQLNEEMNGFQVHSEMRRLGWEVPTVFLTAQWNVQLVVSAMRAGADGFITKPFDPAELLDAVAQALLHARARQQGGLQIAAARARAATLTGREREIVELVVEGLLNKEIAKRLDLALVTVKIHRARAMRKMGVGNPSELARIAALGGLAD